MKRAKWTGGLAEWTVGDTAYLSVAFTWLLRDAFSRALWHRALGRRVVAGGPAFFLKERRHEIEDIAEVPTKTIIIDGKERIVPGDHPDGMVAQRHNPHATFASRGCPVGCFFCIVPRFEGKHFTLIPDFPVRPILCDNNLSALPADYQDHIVRRYQQERVPLLDANSGFEPRTFTEEVYRRWKPILRGPWRFAYDAMLEDHGEEERTEALRVMRMLKDEPQKQKRVYVLIGNEPYAECMARIQEVIDHGCEPHVQPYIKLSDTEKAPNVRFDWTDRKLRDVARWANARPKLWKRITFAEYQRSKKKAPPERYNAQEGLFA